jgi:heterodisulfide reductase subunit A
MSEEAKLPAALIIGAGIAGMQAALDIAQAGFKVYLVERESSIGGHMAQLDKTFPTLDCSSCIMTPRMVEVGQHPNIELLTYSEVEMVEGEAGQFRVRIRKKARGVDADKCTGCGICVTQCPIRNEAYLPAKQAVETEA